MKSARRRGAREHNACVETLGSTTGQPVARTLVKTTHLWAPRQSARGHIAHVLYPAVEPRLGLCFIAKNLPLDR